ncbi:MAG: hypothetical protein QXT02_02015 [Candidatus Hadarchaeum sp.]|uniref:hypothetical protein n=1 Tax=Candidatus Hadarchaeum sp. TaxID=2883567 RepID=UPI0031801023
MSKLDDILSVFDDGKVHGVEEIIKRFSLPGDVVLKVLYFLAEFGFINFDGTQGKSTDFSKK